jgi:nucleoside-diphosphate-sugar epimerase
MRCVVTGAAGFIGSCLCEALLRKGHEVVGVDGFIAYYPQAVKERNLAAALSHPGFQLHRLDLRADALDRALSGADVVFHLAAQAGLAQSWTNFGGYLTCNVQATQRLVEAVRRVAPALRRFVYASTSSVYGRFASGDEMLPTRPVSPYGVTKLAGEHLCRAYADGYGLPLVVLRYFSVYGPGQRPDMGYHRFIRAMLRREPVVVYGDGQQVRGNTYVTDCVEATVAAVEAPVGEIYNVGGGEAVTVWEVLRKLEALVGQPARIRQEASRAGDQRYTMADTNKLRRQLGWEPRTRLDEGLAKQVDWQRRELSQPASGSPAAPGPAKEEDLATAAGVSPFRGG